MSQHFNSESVRNYLDANMETVPRALNAGNNVFSISKVVLINSMCKCVFIIVCDNGLLAEVKYFGINIFRCEEGWTGTFCSVAACPEECQVLRKIILIEMKCKGQASMHCNGWDCR